MKHCTKCNQTKPLLEFSKANNLKDKVQRYCKICESKRMIDYSRSPIGFIVKLYNNQIKSSIRRGHSNPDYSRGELHEFLISDKNFMLLYDNWVASGYKRNLAPSCDRVNENKHYTFDNIEIMKWESNNNRQYDERRNGNKITKQSIPVNKYDLEGNFIQTFASISYAAREIKGSDSALGRAVKLGKPYKGFLYINK